MNTDTTTTVKILRYALDRLRRRHEHLYDRLNTIESEIKTRWPEDTYGMRWIEKYEKRSTALSLELKRCSLAMVGIVNVIDYVEEYKNV